MLATMREIEDYNVEQAILRVAPWDAAPMDPERGAHPLWRLLNGARWYRHGDLDAALACWIPAESDPTNGPVARTWAAYALGRLGRHAEALERLRVTSHLRGEVRCAAGDPGGLTDMRDALAAAPKVEWRAVRLAYWLVRLGQPAAAAELLEQRLTTPAVQSLELKEATVQAWIHAEQPDRAWPHVRDIQRVLPGLARLWASALGQPAPADELGYLPDDVQAVAIDPRVLGLTEAESAQIRARLPSGPPAPVGVLPGPSMWEALGDAAAFIPFGCARVRAPRSAYRDGPAVLCFHPERPGQIFLCLNPGIPAFLWPAASADAAGLDALLDPHARGWIIDEPQLVDLPRVHAVYLGSGRNYPVPNPQGGALVPLDLATFDRLAAASPFLEAPGWGAADPTDPFEAFVDRGGVDGISARQAHAAMDPDRMRSVSYRLRWSRGVVELAEGPSGFALSVRYRPSPHVGAVTALNQRFATAFPDDLPLDAVGVFMHMAGALDLPALVGSVDASLPAREAWRVLGIGMLGHGDRALDDWLAAAPEALRDRAAPVAWHYGRLGHLLRLARSMPQLLVPLQTGPHAQELHPAPDPGSRT